MDGNVLDDVLELERQLREERLKEEALQEQRLAALREEMVSRLAEEKQRLAAERETFLAQVQAAAQIEAEALLEETRRYAAHLDAIDDATLRNLLRQHLPALLPGRSDDRADGTG